jgi:hypothetical protein
MVQLLVSDEKLEVDSTAPLLDIIKASVETKAFQELVTELEGEGTTAAKLLQLFDEWRVIEAREHLRLADGRRSAIDQLDRFIRKGALEVKQMQPLFEKHPWLIDGSWTEASGQTTYTALIRKHCKEPQTLVGKNRRLDIFGVYGGGTVSIIELKRPEKTLSWDDLEQIEHYVSWGRSIIGTGRDAPKSIHGLLLVGKLSERPEVRDKMVRLNAMDVRVETYGDLKKRAEEYYGEAERFLKTVAPEYISARRKR